jgi:hypothetical protein
MAATAQDNCVHDVPRAERIAKLNDELRCNGVGGQILITRGVHALTGSDVSELLKALAAFADFDADSDPHGERDFGVFDFKDVELLWKIDNYCGSDLTVGSDDPADPSVTHRVLTVLLAEEY